MKQKQEPKKEEENRVVHLRVKSDLRERPYGLCAKVGVSTSGMSPRETWGAWNDFRKEERENRKKGKQARKAAKQSRKHVKGQSVKALPSASKSMPRLPQASAKSMAMQKEKEAVVIPALNAANISRANGNSMYNRGTNSEKDYQIYAHRILGWDISDSKKKQLLSELHKRWEKKLSYEAQFVPWTVAGPARYNARRLDKTKQIMQTGLEISDWFKKVEESVQNSKSQYKDDRKEKAQREEEWFNRRLASGMFRQSRDGDALNPKMVADALAPIAQYDTARFVELYEKYDKELHFRKGTNADKIYRAAKSGSYKGEELPRKLHETENLNTYTGKLRSGEERVFMKFTTRPKPQLIYALKKRGWHWNATEGARSVPASKYDAEYVQSIDEKYAKYL